MAYVDPRLQGKPAPAVSSAQMERGHVARLAAMKGSELAFLDQRVPGYQREIINIIGMGVVENLEDPEATLIALVGGPDPGKVDWHPSVIEAARQTGLSVDDEGRLIVATAAE